MSSAVLADRRQRDLTRLPGRARPIDSPMDETLAEDAGRAFPSWPSLLAVAALVGVGVGVPILLGALSGALFIPRNDDPSYRRVALDLFSTGRLQFNGWSEMTLIGQIVFVQPFLWVSGGAPWAFTASTAVLGATGIVTGYSLVRRVLSVPRAALVVLGVLLFPGFLLNTTDYMTDVPAWSAEVMCLALGAVALSRDGRERWLWLGASLLMGGFGSSIREFAIAAPATVLGVLALGPLGRQWRYWIVGAMALAACLGFHVLTGLLPGHRGGMNPDLSSLSLSGLRGGTATLALVLSPALVVAIGSWWRRWRPTDVLAGLVAGLILFHAPLEVVLRTGAWPRVLLGNLIEASGSLDSGALTGARPQLYAPPSWQILNAAALIAGLVFCAMCGGAIGAHLRGVLRGLRDGRGRQALWNGTGSTWTLIWLFAILFGGGMSAWSLVFPMYERYLWPLAVPLYAILLRPPGEAAERVGPSSARIARMSPTGRILRGVSAGFAAVLLVGIALTSSALLVNADAFDAARWQMGDTAAARGIQAETVDAGFEWVAFYATGLATPGQPPPSLGGHYATWWPSFHLCALVSASPLRGANLGLEDADTAAYRLFLFGGPSEPLYLYRVEDPSCPR
jgi:hypothetical protein